MGVVVSVQLAGYLTAAVLGLAAGAVYACLKGEGDFDRSMILAVNHSGRSAAVGAVTGATYPEDLRKLRQQMPHTFFLVPGYGAQGGTAEDVANAFHAGGKGAIINSSRGIMCAWKKTSQNGLDYQEAARQAALAMREDICAYTTIGD